ncbi:hypothetical protein GXW74_22745 [Roseomonas eburnea]|uniref:Uncharacterized protein n=1 Tax=Neoroseomonas eburnea TaxID=1346889 RepID=A0A9X9XHY6_9PROT|nr:hypothetical protein [Neoroseomonas eburnea]MBR0683322.1 hypothetical protein [Neoroseomonas eburnea]
MPCARLSALTTTGERDGRHDPALRRAPDAPMTGHPPPDAVILAITGLHGPADGAAIRAALLRCDPAARLWTDWPRALVAVQSAAPPEALCAAVQGAGYGVLVQGGPGARGSLAGIFGRVVLYGLLGLMGGMAIGIAIGLGNSMFNPNCRGSGNCAIGVGVFGGLGAFVGLPAGAVVGLLAGLARRWR